MRKGDRVHLVTDQSHAEGGDGPEDDADKSHQRHQRADRGRARQDLDRLLDHHPRFDQEDQQGKPGEKQLLQQVDFGARTHDLIRNAFAPVQIRP